VFRRIEPVEVSGKKNAFSLAASLRFNYVSFCSSFVKLLFKRFDVTWQQPGFGEELKFFWVVLLHR